MGARDMSTIETPPQDRLPVETIVIPFDEEVIQNALRRELQRQGQVYFLHNRGQHHRSGCLTHPGPRARSPHRDWPWSNGGQDT